MGSVLLKHKMDYDDDQGRGFSDCLPLNRAMFTALWTSGCLRKTSWGNEFSIAKGDRGETGESDPVPRTDSEKETLGFQGEVTLNNWPFPFLSTLDLFHFLSSVDPHGQAYQSLTSQCLHLSYPFVCTVHSLLDHQGPFLLQVTETQFKLV